jgi:hypothetical protein
LGRRITPGSRYHHGRALAPQAASNSLNPLKIPWALGKYLGSARIAGCALRIVVPVPPWKVRLAGVTMTGLRQSLEAAENGQRRSLIRLLLVYFRAVHLHPLQGLPARLPHYPVRNPRASRDVAKQAEMPLLATISPRTAGTIG